MGICTEQRFLDFFKSLSRCREHNCRQNVWSLQWQHRMDTLSQTQYWFQTMPANLIDHTIQLSSGLKTLSLPFKMSKTHPLSPKLQLLAVILLGNPLHSSVFTFRKSKTTAKYKYFIDRWKIFCIRESENCYTPSVNSNLEFLCDLYKNACYYSRLSSTPSALSTMAHIDGYRKLSDHPFISTFMKGIYNH